MGLSLGMEKTRRFSGSEARKTKHKLKNSVKKSGALCKRPHDGVAFLGLVRARV